MLVEEFFFRTLYKHRSNMISIDSIEPWVFLDCMLDSSFEELKTHVAFPGEDPNFKLIPVIAKRSELLKKLKLDFAIMNKETAVEKVIPLITSLSFLQNLTSLNLFKLDGSHKSVLKFIGNSCPRLSHLSISGFVFMPKDILSVIFGELADQMFQESSETHICFISNGSRICNQLQVEPKVLTLMCSTLAHLELEPHFDLWGFNRITIHWFHVASLVLRNLPLLKNMNFFTSLGLVYVNDTSASGKKFEGQNW